MSFNQTVILGRLTRDPETRSISDGKHSVTDFGVASDVGYGDKKKVCFMDCQAWNKTGDFIAKNFGKGKEIILSGQLHTESWEDKSGGKRSKIVLTVERAGFAGPPDKAKADGPDEGDIPY